MNYRPKKLFTPREATKMLPLVSRIAADISGTYQEFMEEYARFQRENGDAALASLRDPSITIEASLRNQQDKILAYANELEELGVLLKGESQGLVDFPWEKDGKVVFLCWKLGEPEIRYWHEIEAGFSGRKPLILPTDEGEPADSILTSGNN